MHQTGLCLHLSACLAHEGAPKHSRTFSLCPRVLLLSKALTHVLPVPARAFTLSIRPPAAALLTYRYSTAVHRMDAEASDAFLAVRMGDGSIPSERQGGIRVLLPSQYAFKSIKHLDCVSFERGFRPGFWERRGLHQHASVARRQRLSFSSLSHLFLGANYFILFCTSRAVRSVVGEGRWLRGLPTAHSLLARVLQCRSVMLILSIQGKARELCGDEIAQAEGTRGRQVVRQAVPRTEETSPSNSPRQVADKRTEGRKLDRGEAVGRQFDLVAMARSLSCRHQDEVVQHVHTKHEIPSCQWEWVLGPAGPGKRDKQRSLHAISEGDIVHVSRVPRIKHVGDGEDAEAEPVDRDGGRKGARGIVEAIDVEWNARTVVRVRLNDDEKVVGGRRMHLFHSELHRVFECGTLLVVPETCNYRALAMTQLGPGDKALEIGCDFGLCTEILARQCGDAIGVDISPQRVQSATQRFGHLATFQVLDCLSDLEGLRRLGRDRNKVFIDINGNREAETVLAAIANVQQVCGLARPGGLPQGVVVVVKSREVYDLLSSNPGLL